MKRNEFFRKIMILPLATFMLATLSLFAFPSDSTSYTITGKVTGRDGRPLEKLQLLLSSHPGTSPANADSYLTGPDGCFTFAVDKEKTYILELKGEGGSGRVFISPPDLAGEPLNITYPVIEKIVILHTNDLHFTSNNFNELSGKISELRDKYEDLFLFSAGDIFVRHPLRWIVNGRLMRDPQWYAERSMFMISSMNQLGYDLLTPGNHELHYRGMDTRRALEAADFSILAANMIITTDLLPQFDKYKVFNTSTMRQLAVLGLTTGAAPEGVHELDLAGTVRENLFLRDSADVFIALTHLGLSRDRTLAGDFPEFDVIVGGHSHDLLSEAITVNSVLIAQAGGNPHIVSDEHPVYLGKIIIILENGVIVNKSGRVLTISKAEQAVPQKLPRDNYGQEAEACCISTSF
jgi:hypothetical protein